jgi:trimeric autotransporter adhesin
MFRRLRLPEPDAAERISAAASGITNDYAVNPNYRLGYVQIRNLDIQQQIRPTLLLNLDYTGTKGTDLDILEAPNRTATGIRISGVDAFTYENSVADSEANAGTVRLRKRLAKGFSIGGTYTFSKVAGRCIFHRRGSNLGREHSGTWARAARARAEAADRRAEARPTLRRILSICPRSAGFPVSTRRISSPRIICMSCPLDTTSAGSRGTLRGAPFLATGNGAAIGRSHRGCRLRRDLLNDVSDVNAGTNGTLRPDVVPGQSVSLANPSIAEWFNTAAFVAPPSGHLRQCAPQQHHRAGQQSV